MFSNQDTQCHSLMANLRLLQDVLSFRGWHYSCIDV
jgi:hypothetical protein